MKDSIYIMHIPKTGGMYLNDTLISLLNEQCKENNINTRERLKTGHAGWERRKENDYTISLVRNPINRSLSHFIYYNPEILNNGVNEIIKNFMNFVENNNFMHNYQYKFICSDHINQENNFNNSFDTYDPSNISERLSKINRLIKTESINPEKTKDLYNECCSILSLSPKESIVFPDYRTYLYLSASSKYIRDNLSKVEIEYLKTINSLDFDIYRSAE